MNFFHAEHVKVKQIEHVYLVIDTIHHVQNK